MASRVNGDRNFFDNEDFSDVIVKFGDKQIFAHKVILASRSVWFEKAFLSGFSEADRQIIELHDDDNFEAVMAMFRHIYGSDYEEQDIIVGPCEHAGFHLSVFILGDKYDIGSLRDQAAKCFDKFLDGESLSDEYCDDTIYAIQKLLGPQALQLADDSLEDLALDFVRRNHKELFLDSTFRNLIAEGVMLQADFAIEVLNEVCGCIN